MATAIVLRQVGGPEVLRSEEVEVGAPGRGEVRLRQTAIGLNFLDVYHRTGLYPLALPAVPGTEGAGVVEAVGDGVTELSVGDRVGYATLPGAYATERLAPADRLVKLPEAISDEIAAAILLKGMTARYLLRESFRVERGHTILVHAATGGVGLLLCQWAKHLGATVIGTVGSAEKAQLALAHGCHHVIRYREEDFVARVAELTEGRKCAVVYDGVGADTFAGSLDSLAARGMLVSFGNASGPVPPFDLRALSVKGSLFVTRPTLFHYVATRQALLENAAELFEVVGSGAVSVRIDRRTPLAEASRAHRELEARQTSGATLLVP